MSTVDTVKADNDADSADQVENQQTPADSAANKTGLDSVGESPVAPETGMPNGADTGTTAKGDAKGITTRQAKKLFDQQNALFIDARRADQFAKGHIPGAMNIYAYAFGDHIGDVIDIPRDRLIVVYCDGGLCEMSHELADELMQFGFKRVLVYTGGWAEWSETSYPKSTEK
jgi:rhodanese-related sulfurtransferase